jgi:hypothetical protein
MDRGGGSAWRGNYSSEVKKRSDKSARKAIRRAIKGFLGEVRERVKTTML